ANLLGEPCVAVVRAKPPGDECQRGTYAAEERERHERVLESDGSHFQDEVHGVRLPLPLLPLRGQRLPSGGRERAIAGAPLVLGGLPRGRHQALSLEAIQRRVKRALVELKHAPRPLLEPLANAPAVHCPELERLEHEHVEGALEEVSGGPGCHAPFDSRKKKKVRCHPLSSRAQRGICSSVALTADPSLRSG